MTGATGLTYEHRVDVTCQYLQGLQHMVCQCSACMIVVHHTFTIPSLSMDALRKTCRCAAHNVVCITIALGQACGPLLPLHPLALRYRLEHELNPCQNMDGSHLRLPELLRQCSA